MITHELADPIVETPSAELYPPVDSSSADAASLFTEGEWEQFQEADNVAGRAIGRILTTLFLYTVIIMLFVSWWTFKTVGAQ